MKLCFDSIDEVREFVKGLKTSRTKGEPDEGAQAGTTAPAPLQPPNPGPGFNPGFVPPGAGAGPMGGAFPATGAPGLAPEVAAIVARIVARMDGAVASGATKVEDMLTWFRGQCGAEAGAASLDQIKANFLPRLPMPTLENIAKLMSA
jgi:hypothetical protein